MKLDDDMGMVGHSIERCNWQLALYTVHLATGNALACRSVKAATITKYLLSIAKFCARRNPRDPRKAEQTDQGNAKNIQGVLDELKRWENVPDRREPFTIEMLDYLTALLQDNPDLYDQDSFLAVMVDYAGAGLYDGFRLSEWAQPNAHATVNNPQLNFRGDPMAFCLGDVRFLSDDKISIPHLRIIKLDPRSPVVGRDFVRYRTQKNGENGEERQHTRNPNTSAPCHITSMMRVVQRFDRLVGLRHNVPLSVYRHTDGTVRNITASIVESTFRMAAAQVYKLDPVNDSEHLRKWSAHSLRVGACVILHGMGFTNTQIKFLLRWKSDAFFVYLRNIAGLAHQQNQALDKCAAMPHFI
jgi:hypothetical protein